MKQSLKVLLTIILGNAMLAFAICSFVLPYDIMLGGSNGIALVIQHFVPVRLSVISACVNISLFFLGLVFLGWKFAATSLASTIIYPLVLAIFELLPLDTLFNENIVVCALFCGALCGAGIGLVVRAGGSTGGMDIPPCILNKYTGIPVGTSLMFFDVLVVLTQVILKGADGVLLSLVVIVVMSFVVNKVVLSGEKKIQVLIISPAYDEIRKVIVERINCGVTLLDMETGYTGEKRKAILSVVFANRYPEIRDAALALDSHAFIVASEVTNVNGQGYTIERIPVLKK